MPSRVQPLTSASNCLLFSPATGLQLPCTSPLQGSDTAGDKESYKDSCFVSRSAASCQKAPKPPIFQEPILPQVGKRRLRPLAVSRGACFIPCFFPVFTVAPSMLAREQSATEGHGRRIGSSQFRGLPWPRSCGVVPVRTRNRTDGYPRGLVRKSFTKKTGDGHG